MEKNELIHEFQKNALEKVKIQFSEYKGKETIDIRVYCLDLGGDDGLKPSRKGISMERKHMPELFKGIKRAYEIWTEEAKNRKT